MMTVDGLKKFDYIIINSVVQFSKWANRRKTAVFSNLQSSAGNPCNIGRISVYLRVCWQPMVPPCLNNCCHFIASKVCKMERVSLILKDWFYSFNPLKSHECAKISFFKCGKHAVGLSKLTIGKSCCTMCGYLCEQNCSNNFTTKRNSLVSKWDQSGCCRSKKWLAWLNLQRTQRENLSYELRKKLQC